MITSRRTFGLLCATTFLVAGAFFHAPPTAAGENDRYADERIPIEHARRATTRHASRGTTMSREVQSRRPRKGTSGKHQSMVAQAATGRFVNQPPEAPLDGTLVDEARSDRVRQVGFLETYGTNCGPVCDCGSCADPVCGIEEVYHEEPGCGIEVGCGIGAAIDVVAPILAPPCGIIGCGGCAGCAEIGCGIEEIYIDDPGCGIETIGSCSCDACVGGCDVDCLPIFLPFLRVNWGRFDFFAGVQGYKGPLNFANTNANNSNIRSGSGSFGFYQGFNEGRSLRKLCGIDLAAQLGVRATQSNLSGAEFTDETRHQVFVTGGFFRRVDYGLQYGIVVDYLNQDWYFQGDSVQLRGELSWRCATCHVWGFQYMAGVDDDTSTTIVDDGNGNAVTGSIAFEPTDQYRFFYRRLLNQSGQWNAFAGWTDRDDGLLGCNMSLPLRRHLVLSTGATYLIPREGSSSGGNAEEGWNVSMGLIYRVGGPKGCGRYCRPMFDVADNGTFLIDLR